jgi:hypothetical protein
VRPYGEFREAMLRPETRPYRRVILYTIRTNWMPERRGLEVDWKRVELLEGR